MPKSLLPNILYDLHLPYVRRLFEDRVPRGIFGCKMGEVTGGWSTLNNQELHNLYSSLYIIQTINSRTVRMAGNVARIGEKRNV
jgi:hypothetical protein